MQNDEQAFQYEAPLPIGSIRGKLPKPNDRFGYLSARALNVWPDINGNNATFLDDVLAAFYGDQGTIDDRFAGKIVNLNHSIGKGNIVVGAIHSERYIPGVGVDTINRLDKRLLGSLQLDIDEFAGVGQYAKQSIEIMPDHSKSQFIVMKNERSKRLEDQDIYSAEEAAAQGIRRTSVTDPFGQYLHEGKYRVVEAVHPKVMCGVAMLPNPADRNSIVYDLAASLEDAFPFASEYDDIDPYSLTPEDEAAIPDDGFAVNDGDNNSFPLYESQDEYASQSPHPGLIKTAVDALRNPQHGYSNEVHAVAVNRVREAHKQHKSTKDKRMVDETAALNTKISKLEADLATSKDECAELKQNKTLLEQSHADELKAAKDEIASLKAAIEERDASERVAKRLGELKKIKGFEVKADEEAALHDALKAESDDQFEVRRLRAVNAALIKGVKPDEVAGLSTDEHAGLAALLDGNASKGRYGSVLFD
jgi:hypothetical protein